MEEKIKSCLSELESEKGIEILLACETGSRAWGFPSPDSDFDVRIIYKHQLDWYLSLEEKKDSIELFLENNEIDISGWDLRKCLRLLWKSNMPLMERIQSPMIYKVDRDFLSKINLLATNTYSRISAIHHYLKMAKKPFAEINEHDQFKLKKFFYAIRAAVACQWILEKEEIPPIDFHKMLDGVDIPLNIKSKIQGLIKIKSTKSEKYLHEGEPELQDYIRENIKKADNEANQLPAAKGKMEDLNDFFKETLM
jgi:predicted nucleotidyltransferase